MPGSDSAAAATPARPPFPWRIWLAVVILAAVLFWSALPPPLGTGLLVWRDDNNHGAGMAIVSFAEVARLTGAFFRQLFPSAGHPLPLDYLPQIEKRMWETLKIAFAASLIGAFLGLIYTMIGARNLAGARWVYNLGRGLLNLIRTAPDLILAAILASMFGIGPLPGLLALIIFSFGVVAKLLCDTVETIDPGPMEAVNAAGGTRLQRFVFAVFPQILPDFVSYTLYAFEYNVRAAAVLGLVGAGGIGMLLNQNINFLDYSKVGLIVMVTFIAVFLIDSLSTWLRSKLV